LEEVREGKVDVRTAEERLRGLPVADLDFARIDTHRAIRTGFPEVVFCQGKQPSQVVAIIERLLQGEGNILATRAEEALYRTVAAHFPEARYYEDARIIAFERDQSVRLPGRVLVVSAGTADIPVAEEARVTASVMGCQVAHLYDVGVAGIHRLLSKQDELYRATVIIVAAGMDGALPSVVAGLVDKPVIAVPTSVGYGASFNGLAALLTMLNSCASGIAVVNIDNGFGAGHLAATICRTIASEDHSNG
jgi:NCAIR mutase (PurE)-related protein